MSRAIEASALAARPAPSVTAVFLRLVPTVLARRPSGAHSRAAHRSAAGAGAMRKVPGASAVVFKKALLLQIIVLPELNSAAAASIMMAQHVVVVVAVDAGETRSGGGEEREDAEAVDGGVRIGHDDVVVVGVVEGGSGGDHEDVPKAHHAHLGVREAVVE